jgi:DNA gyrase subunit A
MIINKSGISIRIAVEELRVVGRATQGVRLIKLNDEDAISSVEKIQQIEGDTPTEPETPTEPTPETKP